ncbi:MAG: class I SAM-dependent methyltransferase [Longimicrobiales bacterium]
MALGGRRVIGQYRDLGWRARAYLWVRWLICPFDRILALVPETGRLLDVGCGSALWLTYLALERKGLELHGVDPDARKMALAARSSAAAHLELRQGLVEEAPTESFDLVTILDVLCLVPDDVKAGMLRASWRALEVGGSIVVKDADTRPWWKYAPTAFEEFLAVHVLRMTVGRPHFASIEDLSRMLESAGFQDVVAERIDRGYLHPHVVLSGKKKRGG